MSASRYSWDISCWTQQNFERNVNLIRKLWTACPILPCLWHFLQSLETNGYDVTPSLFINLPHHAVSVACGPDGNMLSQAQFLRHANSLVYSTRIATEFLWSCWLCLMWLWRSFTAYLVWIDYTKKNKDALGPAYLLFVFLLQLSSALVIQLV